MFTVLPTTTVSVASFAGGAASVTAAAAAAEWVISENYNFYWVGLG